MSLSLIVAMDKNRLIGNKNTLPWHFKEDLRYFKKMTTGHTVVMGRKTFESILDVLGGPLPNRENIVLSRSMEAVDGAKVIRDATHYFKEASRKDEEVFVIGGANVYALALPYVKTLYITHIDEEYEGDTYFPDIDFSMFDKVKEEHVPPLTFSVYERSAS